MTTRVPACRARGAAAGAAQLVAAAVFGLAAPASGAAASDEAAEPAAQLLDDFADAAPWEVAALPGSSARLRRHRDGSLCLDVDARRAPAGEARLRRELPVRWPAHFDLTLRLRAAGALQRVQLRLIGADGDNVWWHARAADRLPLRLSALRLTRRDIHFAWGPAAERRLRETQAVEFVVEPAARGKGSLCLARLTLQPRDAEPPPPEPRIAQRGRTLDVDFGQPHDFNGLVLRWPEAVQGPLDYDVSFDAGRGDWQRVHRVRDSDGALDALFLPDSRARRVRIGLPRQATAARPALELRSAAQWPHAGAVLAEAAADAALGDFARTWVGQQNHWTLVGVAGGGDRSALFSEDGALEIGRGGYSVEPAVRLDDGSLVTWARTAATHSLREGYLPLPSVRWRHPAFTLQIETAADGAPGTPELLARYVLTHHGDRPRRYSLLLAVRPWQVLPPWQLLGTRGGARTLGTLRWQPPGLSVDGAPPLRFTARPAQVGAAALAARAGLDALLQARPLRGTLHDPAGQASALLRFDLLLAPGASQSVGFVAPLGPRAASRGPLGAPALEARMDRVADDWRARLNQVRLRLPAGGAALIDAARSAQAQILMSRDGALLRPGTRVSAQARVRDGALMSAALLRLGEGAAARDFVEQVAPQVGDDGALPCCIDARGGADPATPHDSLGQYLYLLAEQWRHGGERALLQRHWPQVQRVVARIEALRQQPRPGAERENGHSHLRGLLPPSVAPDGDADRPAYSLWDDFWALRGYKDAVAIAHALGHETEAATWSLWRDAFERDLAEAVAAAALQHGIDHIPAAADRADLDATSTAIALAPVQAQGLLPRALLAATFERWWQGVRARDAQADEAHAVAPLELRNAGALLRLQHAERATVLLDALLRQRRPAGWNQWAERVPRRERAPHLVGDMPHATVAAELIRVVVDLLALEREATHELVIGAGLRAEWLAQGDIEVRGLSTALGPLDYALRRRARGWTLQLERAEAPVRLAWPRSEALPKAFHRGFPLAWHGRELALPRAPATVELQAATD